MTHGVHWKFIWVIDISWIEVRQHSYKPAPIVQLRAGCEITAIQRENQDCSFAHCCRCATGLALTAIVGRLSRACRTAGKSKVATSPALPTNHQQLDQRKSETTKFGRRAYRATPVNEENEGPNAFLMRRRVDVDPGQRLADAAS